MINITIDQCTQDFADYLKKYPKTENLSIRIHRIIPNDNTFIFEFNPRDYFGSRPRNLLFEAQNSCAERYGCHFDARNFTVIQLHENSELARLTAKFPV